MSDKNAKTVDQANLAKALATLQDLAKGHSSRGTNTTKVESMQNSGVGAGSSSGSTQVHHTPGNSDPGSWAGSTAQTVPEDGATDGIAADGTDYAGTAKMLKSIEAKLSKGIPLTAEEFSVWKSAAASLTKAAPGKKDDKEDEEDGKPDFLKAKMEEEDEDKACKSLSDHAADNAQVQQGLEVSEFLAGFAEVVSKSLDSMESRIVGRVMGAISSVSADNGEFQKSLAGALADFAAVSSLQSQRIDQVESTPARASRNEGVTAIEKGGVSGPDDDNLTKSMVADALVDMVKKSLASVDDVVRFDSTGILSPSLEQKVRKHLSN